MNSLTRYLFILIALTSIFSCKNEPKSSTNSEAPVAVTSSSADVSSLDILDHDFNIIPEGSRLFIRGFFNNTLVDGAMTINKGKLHIKQGMITKGEFDLDLKTIEQISNRNETTENLMKSAKVFNAEKYKTGQFIITECTKAVNDQQATHILKGTLNFHDKSVPFTAKARVDYVNKNISINAEELTMNASDFGITMSDPSQDHIFFRLTVNGRLL
ncbi:MAG: YceI family protein [Saprospiraceae bacterium]